MNTRMMMMIVAALAVTSSVAVEQQYPTWVYDTFQHWSNKYGLGFSSPSEAEFRIGVFYKNIQYIEKVNSSQDSYTLEVNGFAAMTVEEFLESRTGLNVPGAPEPSTLLGEEQYTYPSSVNWVDAGAVTEVKNQGQCGSCYAFSAIAGLEGCYQLATGDLVSMSEQQAVDCSQAEGDMGCMGGWMDYVFDYTNQYGIETEDNYPYTAVRGSCNYSASDIVYKNGGWTDVATSNEDAFLTALADRPLSIAIDAESIMYYSGGIYNNPNCGTMLDHGVTAVAYDTGDAFVTVKNSWGSTWGEKGYIRFALVGGDGECGMYLAASYPTY